MQLIDSAALAIAVSVAAAQVWAFLLTSRAAAAWARLFSGTPEFVELDKGPHVPGAEGLVSGPYLQLLVGDSPGGDIARRGNAALEGAVGLERQLEACSTAIRQLARQYERRATVRASVPIYLGLLGTFAGIIHGLFGLSVGAGFSEESIQAFLAGVFVAMIASLIGVLLTVVATSMVIPRASLQCEEDWITFRSRLNASARALLARSTTAPPVPANPLEAVSLLASTLGQFSASFGREVATLGEALGNLRAAVEPQKAILEAVQRLDLAALAAAATANVQLSNLVAVLVDKFAAFDRSLTGLVEAMSKSNELVTGVTAIMDRVSHFEHAIRDLGTRVATEGTVTSQTIELIRQQMDSVQNATDYIRQHANEQESRVKTFAEQHRQKMEDIAQMATQTLEDVGERMKFEMEKSMDPGRFDQLFADVGKLPAILGEMQNAASGQAKFADEVSQLHHSMSHVAERLASAADGIDALNRNSVTSIVRRWANGRDVMRTES